jgi:hypothetical protein
MPRSPLPLVFCCGGRRACWRARRSGSIALLSPRPPGGLARPPARWPRTLLPSTPSLPTRITPARYVASVVHNGRRDGEDRPCWLSGSYEAGWAARCQSSLPCLPTLRPPVSKTIYDLLSLTCPLAYLVCSARLAPEPRPPVRDQPLSLPRVCLAWADLSWRLLLSHLAATSRASLPSATALCDLSLQHSHPTSPFQPLKHGGELEQLRLPVQGRPHRRLRCRKVVRRVPFVLGPHRRKQQGQVGEARRSTKAGEATEAGSRQPFSFRRLIWLSSGRPVPWGSLGSGDGDRCGRGRVAAARGRARFEYRRTTRWLILLLLLDLVTSRSNRAYRALLSLVMLHRHSS